eukprot:s322_g5.t1
MLLYPRFKIQLTPPTTSNILTLTLLAFLVGSNSFGFLPENPPSISEPILKVQCQAFSCDSPPRLSLF